MENRLEHLSEFQQLLDTYQISDQTKATLDTVKLVLLVAPTSTGRNTLIKELIKTGDYHYIISDTTRKPRLNNGVMEQNGKEYWFKSEEEMLDELKGGSFLEAALIHNQQVSGISMREVEKAVTAQKIAITDTEIAGARRIYQLKPDALIIFVLPPNFNEWLRRLKDRGSMSVTEQHRRLLSAQKEFKDALQESFYSFVVNDNLLQAAQQINQLAHGEQLSDSARGVDRELAQELYEQLSGFLENQTTAT